MEGMWLWSALILLFVVLMTGAKNEWTGIRFLTKRNTETPLEISWKAHKITGRVSIAFALIWSLIFLFQAPVLLLQFTPALNILFLLAFQIMAAFTLASGWIMRRKRSRPRLLIHQAIAYFFVISTAALFIFLLDDHVF